MNAQRHAAGIAYLMVAMVLFAMLDAGIKLAVTTLPFFMVLWFRYLVQAITTTAVMLPKQGLQLLRTQHPKFQMLRGMLLMICSLLGMLSLQHMPLAEFAAIALLTPLAVTVVARFALKEIISPLRWLLIFGGFAGAMLIVRPGGSVSGYAALLPILMVVFFTSFQFLTSHMARTENPLTMHFYTGWMGTAVASVLVISHWTTDLQPANWLLLTVLGVLGSGAHYVFILAFARVSPARLSPFLYLQVAFSSLAGWAVFDHIPAGLGLLGMLLIVFCGAGAGWLNVREHAQIGNP